MSPLARLGLVASSVFGLVVLPSLPAEAQRGCRIVISGQASYFGRVTERGPVAVVEFSLGSLRLDASSGRLARRCPRHSETVHISADVPSSDPNMALFLNTVQADTSRILDGDAESAARKELHAAAVQLWGSVVARGVGEIVVDVAWNVAQAIFPVSVSQQIVGSLVVELTKQWLNGGTGDLTRWAQTNGADLLNKVGLDGTNQQLLGGLIQLADLTEKVLSEQLQASVLTATGRAGECDLRFEATLDPRERKASVNFIKTCGDIDESEFLRTQINPGRIAVEPGANSAFTATVKDLLTGNFVDITGGHTQGFSDVTDAGEAIANPAPGGVLNFTFQAADIKEDKRYPVTIHVVTAQGTPRPFSTEVVVLNVPPEVTETPETEKQKPGEFMSLRGDVRILDKNAEWTNPDEVQRTGISTGGHPAELDTARTDAALDYVDCGGPLNGIYTCQITWNKGRVEKPHKHGTFDAELRVRDDDRSLGVGVLGFEVEDVIPEVISLTPNPKKFMDGDGLKVGITAVVADDNGSDDIEDVELDATAAGGGKYPLTAFDYQKEPARRRLDLTLATPFDHVDEEGKYPITLKAMDGAPPDNLSTKNVTERISVGNFPPRLCASGIIWETPQGESRALCPGQPFTIAVCVEDDEGNQLEVIARGAGRTLPLTPSPGTKNWVGTMFAPLEPGKYTFEVSMTETDTPTRKSIVERIEIEVIDCGDVPDVTWFAKVDPPFVCPGQPFSVEPVAQIFENRDMTVIHPDSRVKFEGLQADTDEMRPVAGFTAPDKPGTYQIEVHSNVLGSEVDYGNSIKVDPCTDTTEDIIELLVSPHSCNLFDLGDARDPTVQLQMFESMGSFLSLDYQTRPQASRGWEAIRRVVERFSLTPSVHASEPPAIFLKSLGNSSGEAFDAQILSRGGSFPKLVGEGIVVEPLKKKAQERLQKEFDKLRDKLPRIPLEGKLNAYCLEFLRRPPRPGQLFQLAPRELQEQFAPMRRVLEASRRLEEAGLLNPDSDPAQYLHSIRQWAMWSEEQGFDEKAFGKAFMKRTKENLEGAGRKWNKEIEQAVHSLVPNRWKDIVNVIREAEKGAPFTRD